MDELELAFATKPLRELCESEAKAKQKLGAKIAAVLMHRLADLRAAYSIGDLPIGKPSTTDHELYGARARNIFMSLQNVFRVEQLDNRLPC